MIQGYPVLAICVATGVAFVLATLLGNGFARVGFPLPAGGRIGRVDNLRGYLALATMAHHFVIWLQISKLGGSWAAPSVNLLNSLGKGSVAIFFMVTGLVFYPRILAGLRRTSWTRTYVGRVFRLVPLALVSFLAVAAVILALAPVGHPVAVDGPFGLSVVRWVSGWDETPLFGYADSGRANAFVLWSIWFEWLFYLSVLPACALAMDLVRGRLPTWTVPVALFLVSGALRPLHLLGGSLQYVPLFAIGMLAYEIQGRDSLRVRLTSPWVGVAALLGLGVAMCVSPTPNGPVSLALYAFFFFAVASGNDLAGLLRSRGSLVLGECSYGIYLLHGVALFALFVGGAGSVARIDVAWLPALIPLAALVVCCVTPVTFLLVERPAVRFGSVAGRYLAARIGRSAAMSPQRPVEVAP